MSSLERCPLFRVSLIERFIGTADSVLTREVSFVQSVPYREVHWELQTVSSLERCPLFRVSLIERFIGTADSVLTREVSFVQSVPYREVHWDCRQCPH